MNSIANTTGYIRQVPPDSVRVWRGYTRKKLTRAAFIKKIASKEGLELNRAYQCRLASTTEKIRAKTRQVSLGGLA